MPWFLSHPAKVPAPLTSHCSLVLNLGQTVPGRRLPQSQPRSLTGVQQIQFLQPQCPDHQPQPQPRVFWPCPLHTTVLHYIWDLKQGKGHKDVLCLSRAMHACAGRTSILRECTGLTSFSNPLLWDRAPIQEQWSLMNLNTQGFYFNSWGADPTPDRVVAATENT